MMETSFQERLSFVQLGFRFQLEVVEMGWCSECIDNFREFHRIAELSFIWQ